MDQMTLAIDGMSCGHCVKAVTEALERVQGVRVEAVRIGSARVSYDAAQTSPGEILDAVNEEGYSASRAEPEGSGAGR